MMSGGFLRWTNRVGPYVVLLSSAYPPSSLDGPYSHNVRVDPDAAINRPWGIPVVGVFCPGDPVHPPRPRARLEAAGRPRT
jgi:hypothetical protein